MPKPIIGLLLTLLLAPGCDQMHRQASVRPYEQPKLEPVPGTVPADGPEVLPPLNQAYTLSNPLEMNAETVESGKEVYRHYCWPCHGPKLDGNSTVGPSFPAGRHDLLASEVTGQTDGELYWKISKGSGWHPPLEDTMTPSERWRSVIYLRNRQSQPEQER